MSRHASGRGSASAEQGFTLVEVVVAVAIFVMVTAAALTALIAALNTVRENADRVQAASIARGILEDLQAQGADALLVDLAATDDTSLGAASIGVPVASPYTATVTAAWRSISQYVDPCVQGSELSTRTFLLATVTVDGGTLSAPEVIDGVVP
ncbi:MAG: type II secretion system protein, partial [Candidatus Nanopelagicales bacterium]